MKRLRDLARRAAQVRGIAAALQLSLPLFDPPHATPRLPPRPPLAPPASGLPPVPSGRGRRVARLGGHSVEYELRRSRRRTIGFSVDAGGLRVTAPRWVTVGEIESALDDKSAWILRKLVEWREHAKRRAHLGVRWEDGGTVAFLGRTLTLRLDGAGGMLSLDGDLLRVGLPPEADAEQLRDTVQAWLQGQARSLFAQRLPLYTARLGRQPARWALSSARTRWGSCAPDGSIRLNWRLVHFPVEIVDYVIVHELAHLKEMNHGPRFWSAVQAMLPEFEHARRRLRDFPDDIHLS
jgi:predicted metal-dependent hydrolase